MPGLLRLSGSAMIEVQMSVMNSVQADLQTLVLPFFCMPQRPSSMGEVLFSSLSFILDILFCLFLNKTSKHGEGVRRVVSHHMQGLPAAKPLLDSISFPLGGHRVQVPGHEQVHLGWGEWAKVPRTFLDIKMDFCAFENVHLRVKGGHKPPDHGENVGGIGEEWVR